MAQDQDWIDIRLGTTEMATLNKIVINSEEKYGKFNINSSLAGNIFKSERIIDEDNWLYENVLKKHTEKMFYRDWDNYYKYHIKGDGLSPEFELKELWINYQKQHEFNPIHNHTGFCSFVIFMKIPTHWKEQHALPISANSNNPSASDFSFVWSKKDSKTCDITHFSLSPEDEGRMLFFPAILQHIVYPFYECEEERVTISGNIFLKDGYSQKKEEETVEEKESQIKILESGVESMKKELKQMKKERENVE